MKLLEASLEEVAAVCLRIVRKEMAAEASIRDGMEILDTDEARTYIANRCMRNKVRRTRLLFGVDLDISDAENVSLENATERYFEPCAARIASEIEYTEMADFINPLESDFERYPGMVKAGLAVDEDYVLLASIDDRNYLRLEVCGIGWTAGDPVMNEALSN